MFLNIHSLISILIILVYHTAQCLLLSFEPLGNKDAINALHKTNYVVSYSNIFMQNDGQEWFQKTGCIFHIFVNVWQRTAQ